MATDKRRVRRVHRKIDKVLRSAAGEWEQKTVGELGDSTGRVKTDVPGMVFVRTRNGDTLEVYNNVAPEDKDVKVWIGRRRETPTVWEVITQRDSYAQPQAPRISYHGAQHMFRAPDEVPIDRKQITQHTIMVYDADDFIVVVFGGPITSADGNAIIQTQFVDLAPYLPAIGAVFVTIESDSDGILTVNEGNAFDGETMATPDDIPLPSAGMRRLGWILLFEAQEELLDEHIYVPMPLETNFEDAASGTQIHDAPEATTLADADEFGFWQAATGLFKKITWVNIVVNLTAIFDLLYAQINHDHEGEAGTGHVHALVRWVSDGGDTFDYPDIVDVVEVVALNGLIEDPTIYSLSADATQLVFDTTVTAGVIITSNYIIAQV